MGEPAYNFPGKIDVINSFWNMENSLISYYKNIESINRNNSNFFPFLFLFGK